MIHQQTLPKSMNSVAVTAPDIYRQSYNETRNRYAWRSRMISYR